MKMNSLEVVNSSEIMVQLMNDLKVRYLKNEDWLAKLNHSRVFHKFHEHNDNKINLGCLAY